MAPNAGTNGNALAQSGSPEESLRALSPDGERGLSPAEAAARLAANGFNELSEKPGRSVLAIFGSQFVSFLVFVLIAAAAISAWLGEWIDSAAIVSILILNAGLGTVQEYRAEKAIAALKRMVAPTAQVIRGGRQFGVPARELVAGDIVLLEAGTIVPADCPVVWAAELQLNEAVLTGESQSVSKGPGALDAPGIPAGQRASTVFSGTTVASGRARALVIATGMRTEFGRIASSVQEAGTEETPLRKSIEKLGKQLTLACLAACALIFGISILESGMSNIADAFMRSVSLAVAAIPEGLMAVITVSLALGVQRMSKRNAIVRRLTSVETLGSANVICTDKTGTLTKNEMVARTLYVSGEWVTVSGSGYSKKGTLTAHHHAVSATKWDDLYRFLRVGVLCNNAGAEENPDGSFSVVGDPTEAALIVLAAKAGVHRGHIAANARFLREIPFDSNRKMMSVAYDMAEEGPLAFVKGAPEAVLAKCTHYLEKGAKHPLTEQKRSAFLSANREMASHALRVLALAGRAIPSTEPTAAEMEGGLAFIGLVGLIDAPREGVKEAIALARHAGIEVVMVTGDNEDTAYAVGKEIGLVRHNDRVLTGAALDAMDDAALADAIERVRIFARVSPEHKIRIVNAWKAHGKTVAMTGDGVNDAPALKRADIGIAMGITGTDVAKEVSDIVLADDNFVSIVRAVQEGRGIYANIRKVLAYLVSCNIAEVLIVLSATLLGHPLPLTAIQLLWINLVTDGLPAVALASDTVSDSVMKAKPRAQSESIWNGMGAYLFGIPALAVIISLALLYAYGPENEGAMVFSFLIFFESSVALASLDIERPLGARAFSNKWLLLAVAFSVVLQLAVISTPATQMLFGITPLGAEQIPLLLGLGSLGFFFLETYKWVANRSRRL